MGVGVVAWLADRALQLPATPLLALFVAATGVEFVFQLVSTFAGEDAGLAVLGMLGPLRTAGTFLLVALVLARPNRQAAPGALWLGAVALPVAATVVELLVRGSIHQGNLVRGLIITAFWFVPRLDLDTVVRAMQVLVGAILALSVVGWLGGFGDAVDPYDTGLLPLGFRVAGMMDHPNSLGPLCVLFVLLDRLRPAPGRRFLVPVAFVLLVVSQSKTSWVMAAFAVLAIVIGDPDRRETRVWLGLAAVGGAALLLLSGASIDEFVGGEELESARSLTGRTTVWAHGIEAWQEGDILLGQGAGVFEDYAQRTGQDWAGQAHNQFIQTIAEQGLLGVAALLAYGTVLVQSAFRHARATRGVTLALVGSLLLRAQTETPLDNLELFHVATLLVLFALERARARSPVLDGVGAGDEDDEDDEVGQLEGAPLATTREKSST